MTRADSLFTPSPLPLLRCPLFLSMLFPLAGPAESLVGMDLAEKHREGWGYLQAHLPASIVMILWKNTRGAWGGPLLPRPARR